MSSVSFTDLKLSLKKVFKLLSKSILESTKKDEKMYLIN